MSPREREHIRNRLVENKARLEGHIVVAKNRATGNEGMDPRRMGRMAQFIDDNVHEDLSNVAAKVRRDEQLLKDFGPKPVSKRERPAMERRVEENRAWLATHMCPKSLYYLKADHPDFGRAKAAADQEHSAEYMRRADEFKRDMRRIDPDNDQASNLERLRPQS